MFVCNLRYGREMYIFFKQGFACLILSIKCYCINLKMLRFFPVKVWYFIINILQLSGCHMKKKCDLSLQNRAVVCYQEKCDIPFIWKSILLTQRWYHSYVNWMQHWNFMDKNKYQFLFIFFVFSYTNGVISWNALYRQLPCFDVMGHKFLKKWVMA